MFDGINALPPPLVYALAALVLIPAIVSVILCSYFLLFRDIRRVWLVRHKRTF